MSIKYKVLGFAAAAAMTLGVAGGASADSTSATLANGPGPGCTAAASGGNVDFGTYTWNGTGYDAPGSTSSFTLSITNNLNSNNCSVSVSGTDLTQVINSTTYTIDASNVSLDATPDGAVVTGLPDTAPGTALFTDVLPDDYTVDASLAPSGLDHLPTGPYAGTIVFTTSEVAP